MSARVLVVGQGIAGAALAWRLHEAGVPVAVSDSPDAASASRVAAGLMNPIAGKRMTSPWRAGELIPDAAKFYSDAGKLGGRSLIEPVEIWRVFRDETEVAQAAHRRVEGTLGVHDGGNVGGEIERVCHAPLGGMRIPGGSRVDVGGFLEVAAARLRAAGIPSFPAIDPGELHGDATGVTWRGERFDCAILCTGAAAVGAIPGLSRVGGEIARLRVSDWPQGVVLSAGTWFAPDGSGTLLAGSTHRPGSGPDLDDGAKRLGAEASRWLRVGFSIDAVVGATRAAMPDRMPAVGWNPGAGRIGVTNGLGSRGAMLAPWLAEQWTRHLMAGADFDRKLSPDRFSG